MESDFLEIQVLEDPEMAEVGQRLIMQGNELLDVTDLESDEKKRVENILSRSWEGLRDIKILKDLLLRTIEGYRNGRPVHVRKGVDASDLFGGFVDCCIKVLNECTRLLKLQTRGQVVFRFYAKRHSQIIASVDGVTGANRVWVEALTRTMKEADYLWMDALGRLQERMGTDEGRKHAITFRTSAPRENGAAAQTLSLSDGRKLEEYLEETWAYLVAFFEEFIAYAIQLRFLQIVEGLEVIPRECQDPVYPRKFRIKLRGACPESDENRGWP